MSDPERAQRLWLAVAVATLWLVSVGAADEPTPPAESFPELLPAAAAAGPSAHRRRRATRLRLVSVFRRGWCRLLAAFLRHDVLPTGQLVPEPWPTSQLVMESGPLCTS